MKPSRSLKNCTSENNMPLREMKICTPKLKNFHSDTSIPLAEEHSQKRKRRRRKKIPLKRNVPVDDFDIDPWTYLGNLLTNNLRSNQVEINTDSKTQKTVARLKEPRDLFELPSDLELVPDLARWPSECQVVEEKIHHIEAMPNYQEKYYEVTGKEVQPKPAPDTDGTTVFSYSPVSPVNYFSRSTTRGNLVAPEPSRNGPDLRFESRFESGNLAKAIKMTDSYYQLYLRTDLYTDRHTQWFYFMVENMKKNYTYRFSIVNLCKGKSLYSVGMKPVMYSTKCAIENKLGWHRCGTNITYFRNDNGKEEDDPDNTYTLSFQLEFPHDEDCVFLAHSYPYTYSNLQQYLIKLQNHPTKSLHTSLKPLCKTLAGNNVYLLTITEPPDEDDQPKKKKGIVITARVHPGETPSSYMMKGLIDFLTGDSKAAKELRGRFIFKVVPMLNPDGVIVGNSRCSLSGRDLNRQYRTVIRETYPPVCYTKLMIRRMMDTYGVAMYCDFHAHSSKHSVFIYGCENKRSQEKRLQEQIFPLMLHKNSSDKFSFENCKFRVQKNKEGTGRVVMWMLGIENSYTLEASFAGSTLGLKSCIHFNTHDYEAMGRSFCETLLDFIDDSPIKIPLMTLNLESGDCQSSGDEKSHQSFQQSKLEPTTAMEQAKVTSRVDSILMPPELVITSTQGNDLSVFERLYKCAQPKEISHSPTKKDICQKCSPRRTKSSVSPSDGKEETTQRSHIYLRHQYWKVFSNGNVSWQSNINDHEELLKACSDKLAELKKKHKLRKIKYAEKAVMSVPKLFTESQRLKRKSRSFTIGRSYSFREHCVLSFEEEKVIKKKDSSPEENKEEIIKKNKVKSKKFRKGGLVSLAAVQKKRENDAHTVLEKQETLPGKKKKKKKKLTQLQKRVKNAVQTVGIVTGRKSGKH